MADVEHRHLSLLDRAIAAAKRAGHGTVSALHLAAALIQQDEQRSTEVFGDTQLEAIEQALRPGGSFVGLPDPQPAIALLGEVGTADVTAFVAERLQVELAADERGADHDGRPMTPGTAEPVPQPIDDGDTHGPASGRSTVPSPEEGRSTPRPLPKRVAEVATIVEGQEPSAVLGRDDAIDALITALGRQDPATPLIVGPAGSGRTSVIQGLADRLAMEEYRGPLAGHTVITVDAAGVIAKERAATLRGIVDAVAGREDSILVLDDAELLAGLAWGQSIDISSLGMIRSAVGRSDLRLVVVLDDRFRATLEVHDGELASELEIVPLEPLAGAELAELGARTADELAEHHGVTLAEHVIRAASTSPAANQSRQHPALLVARLDAACVRAAMQGRTTVEVDDLDLVESNLPQGADGIDVHLYQRIVGQDLAVERVTGRLALTRNQMDLRPERPDGVFLFVGPTGVGKTAFALGLAEALGGSPASLIRLDMSEYVHETAVNRLVGPPPGYVGSTEPSQWLTTRINEQPDAVVLLDEIEKAHPKVWNALLQVFDAGTLTDGRGTSADFSRAVIIMTSNLGAAAASRPAVGFGVGEENLQARKRDRTLEMVRETFPPELFNRIDEVIVFDPLTQGVIHEVASRELAGALLRLERRGLLLELGPGVVDHLAETGYDPAYGARHLQRNIERLLLQPAARLAPGRYAASIDADSIALLPTA